MVDIGQALKKKRIELGLSLEVVEEQTKIRKRYLEAIETGDWSVLPGDVYARGFVRAYAEAVGLDGRELLAQKEFGQSGEEDLSSSGSAHERPLQTPDKRVKAPEPAASKPSVVRAGRNRAGSKQMRGFGKGRRSSGVGVNVGQVAFVVVVLVLLGVCWWALTRSHGTSTGNGRSPGTAQVSPNSNATSNLAGSANGSSGNQTLGNTTNNTTNTTPPTPTVQVTSSSAPNGDVTYTVSSTPAQPLSAKLSTTTAACWVRVTEDGHLLNSGGKTLTANSSKMWSAKQSLSIRIGNLNGLSLVVNGQSVTLPNVNHPVNVTIVPKAK